MVIDVVFDFKVFDFVVLNFEKFCDFIDFFVVCSGMN